MHNKTFNLYESEFSGMYPQIRYVNGVPQRPSPRDWQLAGNLNYEMCRVTDLSRVWLYIDLAEIRGYSVRPGNWFRNYLSIDFLTFQTALNGAYEMLRREPWQRLSVSQFKAEIKIRCGFSAPFLLAPLWSRTEHFLLSKEKDISVCVDLMRDLVQWTRAAQKVRFINDEAHDAAYQKFADNDERLYNHWKQADSKRDIYLDRIRSILKRWHKGIVIDPSRCSHGSGASSISSTGRCASAKCRFLQAEDARLAWYDKKYHINPRADLYIPSLNNLELSRSARFLSVDKNIEARRGIGPQHPSLMWRQQGVRAFFYEDVFTRSFYREHMPIFDRSVNQCRALEGSKFNNYATIDLSSASDSVSVHLVKAVYAGEWRELLLLNRSTSFDVAPDRMFTTYATMGDASTFPTETEIIAACVQLSLDLAKELYSKYNRKFILKRWHVFGDDIVVQNDAAVLLYLRDILYRLGFLVNDDKSFYHGPYRESCGVEAYLGYSIEPFYIRYKPMDKATRLYSLISLANHAFWRGYKALRQFYLCLIRHEVGYRMIPFTEHNDDSSRVYTPYLDVNRIKTEYDKGTQALMYVSVGLRSPIADQRSVSALDNYAYYAWKLTHRKKDVSSDTIRLSEQIDFRERRYKITVARAPVRLFVR